MPGTRRYLSTYPTLLFHYVGHTLLQDSVASNLWRPWTT